MKESYVIKYGEDQELFFPSYKDAKEVFDELPNGKYLWNDTRGELLEGIMENGEHYC